MSRSRKRRKVIYGIPRASDFFVTSATRFHSVCALVTRPSISFMNRKTITFTISLPPEMARQVDQTCQEEHRTRSELFREALRCYSASRALVSELPFPSPSDSIQK